MPPLDLYARVHHLRAHSHTRPRVQQAPGIPCALLLGRMISAKLGRMARRENADAHSLSSPGLTGRPSIPEAAVIEPTSRGVLDPPHARGMTIEGCVAISRSLRAKRSNPLSPRIRKDGLLRGACHHCASAMALVGGARIRATRWLAMTAIFNSEQFAANRSCK
jgi:hypothetical protein